MQQDNTVVTRPLRLGLLIDAENLSRVHAPRILAQVRQLGRPIVRRAYGDWTTSQLTLWKGFLDTLAIRPCQQFHYRNGRNASGAALIMDGMEMLHYRRLDGLCLASSDSDFTDLVARYQEADLPVFGFGLSNAPAPFKAACDAFFCLDMPEQRVESAA